VAIAGPDGTIGLWDGVGGKHLRDLTGHTSYLRGLAFDPAGKLLASTGGDRTLRLWDLEGERGGVSPLAVRTLESHDSTGMAVVFSPDGRYLAAGWLGGTVTIHDMKTRKLCGTLERVANPSLLAFSPDSKRIAVGGGIVRLHEPTGKLERELAVGYSPACLAFSPDGKKVVLAGAGVLEVWDVEAKKSLHTLARGLTTAVTGLAFLPAAREGSGVLLSLDAHGRVRLWDVDRGKEVEPLAGHRGPVNAVAFSPDGKTLATGGADGTVRLWSLADGKERLTLNGGKRVVRAGLGVAALAYSPDGKVLVAGGEQGDLLFFDPASGNLLRSMRHHYRRIVGLAFSPDGKTLVSTGEGEQSLVAHDLTKFPPGSGTRYYNSPLPVSSLTLAPDGKTLVYRSGEWACAQVPPGYLARRFRVGRGPGLLALRGDGGLLAAAEADGTITLWQPGKDGPRTLKGGKEAHS
jgi:WD40 repeat protein